MKNSNQSLSIGLAPKAPLQIPAPDSATKADISSRTCQGFYEVIPQNYHNAMQITSSFVSGPMEAAEKMPVLDEFFHLKLMNAKLSDLFLPPRQLTC